MIYYFVCMMICSISTHAWGAEKRQLLAAQHYWTACNKPTCAGFAVIVLNGLKEQERQDSIDLHKQQQAQKLGKKRYKKELEGLRKNLGTLLLDDGMADDATPAAPKHADKGEEEKRPF